jgi:hypothetical protein
VAGGALALLGRFGRSDREPAREVEQHRSPVVLVAGQVRKEQKR